MRLGLFVRPSKLFITFGMPLYGRFMGRGGTGVRVELGWRHYGSTCCAERVVKWQQAVGSMVAVL